MTDIDYCKTSIEEERLRIKLYKLALRELAEQYAPVEELIQTTKFIEASLALISFREEQINREYAAKETVKAVKKEIDEQE